MILIVLAFGVLLSIGCKDNLDMNEITPSGTYESTDYPNLGLDEPTMDCENLDSIDQLIAETSLMFFDSLWIDVSHPNFVNFNDSMDVFMTYVDGLDSINYPEFIDEFSAHFNVSKSVVNEYFTIMGENYSYLSNLSDKEQENLFVAISCLPDGSNSESSMDESEERLIRWAINRWGGEWGSSCHGQIVGGVIDSAIGVAAIGLGSSVGFGILAAGHLTTAVVDMIHMMLFASVQEQIVKFY